MGNVRNHRLIVDLLNQDIQGEHGAIIQYLYHAWTLDLPGISSALESIAREEMYHLQWLALRVSELGGNPSIGRYPVYLEAPSFQELVLLNSKAEEEAIAQYEAHIEEIDDERTVRLLQRIISDEKKHAVRFESMAQDVAAMEKDRPQQELSPEAQRQRDELLEMLNAGVRHEYSVVVQYLHQAYTANDRSFGHAMEQSAIVEMKHMGWLAEHVAEMGGRPHVERNKVILADNEVDMIKANIEDEEKATSLYDSQIASIDQEEVRDLLSEIRDHEEYHLYEMKHFLKTAQSKTKRSEPEKTKPKYGKGLTVGSLLHKKEREDSHE